MMPSFRTTIKIETECSPVQPTLWFPDNSSESILEALTPTGKVRNLDPGVYYIAASAVGQVPGTQVKITMSTNVNSTTRIQRVSKKGTLRAQPDFTIDSTGAVL